MNNIKLVGYCPGCGAVLAARSFERSESVEMTQKRNDYHYLGYRVEQVYETVTIGSCCCRRVAEIIADNLGSLPMSVIVA